MKNDYIVYKHTSPSGKMYIGITNNYSRRSREHQQSAARVEGFAFHSAIRKYGWEQFTHEILAFDLTKQQALDMEVALIEISDKSTLYNLTLGGEGVEGIDSESIRKGKIANRKDSVKGYSWNSKAQSYKVGLHYLGKNLAFGYLKDESDAEARADYLMSLSDEQLLKAHEEYKTSKASRTKGYTFNKASGKFKVQLTVNGKSKVFGYYMSEEEAIDRVTQLRNEF